MEQLPDDLLADVLGRLPPISLAASRCVRKHWCCIVDGRRLLRADLLPLRLEAFYCINLDIIDRLTYLFARPSAARRIPGGFLDFLEDYTALEVQDHCNGLLLAYDMVINPATRQWATLPTCPDLSIDDMLLLDGVSSVWKGTTSTAPAKQDQDQDQEQEQEQENYDYYGHQQQQQPEFLYSCCYLVYDPMAESPQHFEVFLVPLLDHDLLRNRENITIDLEEQEWPPSTFRTHVFSSRRWRWEERSFLRQGEPAGTMADMLQYDGWWQRKAVYFRGALYVHCQNDSIMRIEVSNDKYQMIASPITRSKFDCIYLGKSEKGVYFALLYRVDSDSCAQFRVWLLKEEANDEHQIIHMEWILKTNISVEPLLALAPIHNIAFDEWRIIRYYNDEEDVPPAAAQFAADDEWDFDNATHDIVLQANKDNKAEASTFSVDFLGFHPYKEIVFFSSSSRTISYNFCTSKVQQLGDVVILPVGIRTCFPYTPCLVTMEKLFKNS